MTAAFDRLKIAVEQAKAKLAAMSEEERQAMWQAQRESFVRGMTTPCEHGALDFEQCQQCRSPVDHVMGCNPLQERAIYDRVRSAYDQGYNDARVAGNVARDGAPGYRGRDKQAEIGAELLSDLRRLARAPAEHEVVADEMATTYKAAFRVVFDRWLNDENGIPQENIGLIATKAGLQAVFDSLANEGKP
jgi:hypothetical protein